MKDLEKSIGMHRRVKGVGKSNKGDQFGTFEFRWRHNAYSFERKVVCEVIKIFGWERLHIVVHEAKNDRFHLRAPIHAEIQRLLPLFFEPNELPVQFHQADTRSREGVTLWYSKEFIESTKTNLICPFS